jgi:hypothetical protein
MPYIHEPGAYQVPFGQPPFSATVVPVAAHVRFISPFVSRLIVKVWPGVTELAVTV